MAVCSLCAMSFSMQTTAIARSLSSGAVGSSASMTGGRLISPRAIETRCCVRHGSDEHGGVDYLRGANLAAFAKIAEAMLAQGVV